MRRSLLIVCGVFLIALAAGCSQAQQQPAQSSSVPAPSVESTQQAVARLFGTGARVTVAKMNTVDKTPGAYVVITTDATPTAAAVLGALVPVTYAYGTGGRVISLQVDLPDVLPSRHDAVILRWNPTGKSLAIPGRVASYYAPGSLTLDTGTGGISRGAEILSLDKYDVRLGSGVTTEAVLEGASGQGSLVRTLRASTLLR
jgi:hypothetical protein